MTDPNPDDSLVVPLSGIVLPAEASLPLKAVKAGLYVVEGAHASNVDFFGDQQGLPPKGLGES